MNLKPLWNKFIFISFLVFIMGVFLSRSLAQIAIITALIISFGIFPILLKSTFEKKDGGSTSNRMKIRFLFFLCGGSFLYLGGWLLIHRDWNSLAVLGVSMGWPCLLWWTGWKRKVFTDRETVFWWFANGLLWWFIVSFALRNVDINTSDQIKGILSLAFSFTVPFTLFYLFFKMAGIEVFLRWSKVILSVGAIGFAVLALMGLPSLFSLSKNWKNWGSISESLALSYNPGRLSSFHFVLDLANILAQGLFISLGGVLSRFFFSEKNPRLLTGGLVICLSIFILLVSTWTKLLIPLVVGLLMIFFIIGFRQYRRYLIRFGIGLSFLLLIFIGLLANTDNDLKKFSRDLIKAADTVKTSIEVKDGRLVTDLAEANLVHAPSIIYRLQHHIWGFKILLTDPFSGIGPFGYTDYVISKFKKEMAELPYILFDGSVSLEEKKSMIESGIGINRSLLSPHSDLVMIISSGGIPGMIFRYGWFAVLICFFLSRYFRERNIFYLGIGFALLAMLASGITEVNFKDVHFHLVTLYSLFFFMTEFLFAEFRKKMIRDSSSENLRK